MLCTYFSGRWGFSPHSSIWHKLCLEYLLGLFSSRPSSFWKSCPLAWSYRLQSNKKCCTDSRLPHWQYLFTNKKKKNTEIPDFAQYIVARDSVRYRFSSVQVIWLLFWRKKRQWRHLVARKQSYIDARKQIMIYKYTGE